MRKDCTYIRRELNEKGLYKQKKRTKSERTVQTEEEN